jgi:ResB-like family
MKKLLDIIFSPRTTIILLLIFAIAIGAATFIEDKYDTETAQHVVYNAKWFEFLLLLMVLNFIGSVKNHNLLSKRKWASLLFHCAFIVIIIGAGVTRYTGFTGTMHIRQGEAAAFFYSTSPYLSILTPGNTGKSSYDHPVHISKIGSNAFSMQIDTKERGPMEINLKGVLHNTKDSITENVPGGIKMLQLVVPGDNGRVIVLVKEGEIKDLGKFTVAFNNETRADVIKITAKDNTISIVTPFEIKRTQMAGMLVDTILSNVPKEFKERCLYETPMGVFVCKKIYNNAKDEIVESGENEKGTGPDALILEVVSKGKKHDVKVLGGSGYIYNYQDFDIDGCNLRMAYGEKEIELPFALFLDKFILDRYAGSMSPSSFASEVTLIDDKKGLKEPHRIFMNNVLDYQGYRFFQTSYDPDEKGTILSVNHDFYGTWITYIGYFLLGFGFLITLFSKNSRFYVLGKSIRKSRLAKAAAMVVALWFCSLGNIFAQAQGVTHVSKDQADKFGHLIAQTYDGRFEPVHTMAYDALHKLARKDVFNVEGVGDMDAMQVYLDMMLNGEFWKTQKIIMVREKSVQDLLGITGNYASFNDFFDTKGEYKLKDVAETSFRKKQAEQNTFDKEIIKVDERANVCMMVINGSMLKLFPVQGSPNNVWTAWNDSLAHVPLTGSVKMLNEDLQLREFNYYSIMGVYLQEVFKGTKSGDYARADKIRSYISSIQRQSPAANIIPSESMVSFEINYNKAQIFNKLKNWYGMIALVLLVLSLTDVLREKKSKVSHLWNDP